VLVFDYLVFEIVSSNNIAQESLEFTDSREQKEAAVCRASGIDKGTCAAPTAYI
jgi:hypothetical protein